MSNKNIPLDPAAVTLMAGIIAESISKYSTENPKTDLSSINDVRDISENVAADMITAVASLAGSMVTMPGQPAGKSLTKIQSAAAAYKKNKSS